MDIKLIKNCLVVIPYLLTWTTTNDGCHAICIVCISHHAGIASCHVEK